MEEAMGNLNRIINEMDFYYMVQSIMNLVNKEVDEF